MAKNLFDVVQTLLVLSTLLAAVWACIACFENVKAKNVFLWGLLTVFVLSVILAFLRDKRIIKYNQVYNIYLLVVSILAGIAFCVFMWIDCAREKTASSLRVPAAVAGDVFIGSLFCWRLPTILVMPFHFVGKDESYFSTYYLTRLTGFLLAFCVLAFLALSLYKVLTRFGKPIRVSAYTAFFFVHLFNAFTSVIGIINSYYRRKIKLPNGLRTKLPLFITVENTLLFVVLAVLAVIAVLFIIYNFRIHGEYENPAWHRRLKMIARNNRRWGAFLCALIVFCIVDFTVIKKAANKIVELSPSEEYQIDGDEIFIPLAQVSDGHLHRFTWTNEKGKAIRFIIVQKQGMSFGIGFDACEICGNVGYYERKNEVVCNRCDVVMNKSTIGLKGGCNPIPLDSKIEGGGIVIYTGDLDAEAGRF